jgi:ribosomal protein L2
MPVKQFRPMTAGTRFRSISDFSEVTHSGRPEKSLTEGANEKSGGRNHHGHVTSRRRGGGHKRLYRLVDFKRNKPGVPGKVAIWLSARESCPAASMSAERASERAPALPQSAAAFSVRPASL